MGFAIHWHDNFLLGFPGRSAGKESTYNSGDPGWIPGSGRSTGEEIGYPLLYCQASLVAQMVKKPPAMQETWVRSLVWEDPLEEGTATQPNSLAWRIPMDRDPGRLQSMGSQRVRHDWVTKHTAQFFLLIYLLWIVHVMLFVGADHSSQVLGNSKRIVPGAPEILMNLHWVSSSIV